MKLRRLKISNFRSIELLVVEFPSFYTAISGKNNSGKSNLLKAIKVLFQQEPRYRYRLREEEISFSQHFPAWKGKNTSETIKFSATLIIEKALDTSVFKLIEEFFKFEDGRALVELEVSAEYLRDKDQAEFVVQYGDMQLDSFKSRTVIKSIRSSGAFQFYNSTEPDDPFFSHPQLTDLLGELSKADRDQLVKDRDRLSRTVSGFAKKHQKDISELLGRLEEKYTVGLSAPQLDIDFLPINITLGDKKIDVSLDEWGSGTRNRTNILLTLFKAKRLSESQEDDTKITPIIVIEEPESFLHPSAQAEFGRLIQDLCDEFQVQVLVATHSPYFLSQQRPESNVLLCRESESGHPRYTERLPVNGDNWMEPFALNLGLSNPEFEPWRDLFFSRTNKILLVEGEIDKEYFEMLRDENHGPNKLCFDGEIFAFGGTGNIDNGVLLRFIKGKYHRFFVTYDLDADAKLSKLLQSLGMERAKHYYPIGIQGGGRNKIEGLLPESVRNVVFGQNGDLVQQVIGGANDEAKSAKQRLKRLLLDEFVKQAKPGLEYFSEFYKVVKVINKAMI
ncbi:ATP-dependent nuclease [Thiobaca trueperi]|uniref:Putative ATP-dependent endonuclease of OLD family n=1 Tax=Thiobaca trueperi TaxID=127458 RepID=A0A4V2V2A4_9GAMM|nr:AAA family ATPase [Thiobaca trueperi]TCT24272.1 putative ATP-dependent endonuclease of OLD family [Thiobaca trueperi]